MIIRPASAAAPFARRHLGNGASRVGSGPLDRSIVEYGAAPYPTVRGRTYRLLTAAFRATFSAARAR